MSYYKEAEGEHSRGRLARPASAGAAEISVDPPIDLTGCYGVRIQGADYRAVPGSRYGRILLGAPLHADNPAGTEVVAIADIPPGG